MEMDKELKKLFEDHIQELKKWYVENRKKINATKSNTADFNKLSVEFGDKIRRLKKFFSNLH